MYNFPKLQDLEVGDVIYVEALWGSLGDSYWRKCKATVVDLSGGMNRNVSLKYHNRISVERETCHIDKIEGRRLSKLDKVLE